MNSRLFDFFVIVLVILGGALALYLRTTPSPLVPVPVPQKTVEVPLEVKNIPEEAPVDVKEAPVDVKEAPIQIKTQEPIKKVPVVYVPYNVDVDPKKPIEIGFLGESRADGGGKNRFNAEILKKIFSVYKYIPVNAVFFAGNLVSGLTVTDSSSETKDSTPSDSINDDDFKQQLKEFSLLYSKILGKVPLFPMVGRHEMELPKGIAIFRNVFDLDNSVTFEDNTFAYTVTIGDVFFAVIPSDVRKTDEPGVVERSFSLEMLSWLQQILSDASSKYRYRFVVGHEPAYGLRSTFSDSGRSERESFWKILVANNVLAYFSSHEHVFDRTNRHGVWEIISGGAGAPLREGGGKLPFFHGLLLTIPPGKKNLPFVTVVDVNGKVVDEFILDSGSKMLYQQHISSNLKQ